MNTQHITPILSCLPDARVEQMHAILAPSSATRWLACPPSARLEQMFPDKESDAASEGTLAHRMAELSLKRFNNELTKEQAYEALKECEKHEAYTIDMNSYVDVYVTAVIEECTPDARLFIERPIVLHNYAPASFGTVDACVYAGNELHIFDLKYGKGVKVDAEENPQLMLYGLGLLDIFKTVETVTLHIVQPRLYHNTAWTITASELRAWGQRTLKPTAVKAYMGAGKFCSGEHCRFCKAKGACKHLAEECTNVDFKSVATLSPAEVSEMLPMVPMIESWCKALQEQALSTIMGGTTIPNYKVVEGRSIRKLKDEKALLEALMANGVDKELVTKTSLIGLGELEKLLGKKEFANTYGDHIYKPQGKPTLVTSDDKREAITASTDFDNINV